MIKFKGLTWGQPTMPLLIKRIMIEHIGYFKEFEHDTYEFGTRCVVRGKTNTYQDNLPKDNDGDCYRVSLIDGTLVVKKWVSKNKDFIFIMASSSFKIEQK